MLPFNRLAAGVIALVGFAVCSQAVWAHKVDLDVKCEGEHHDAKVVITWKHEGHDQTIEVRHGDKAHETVEIPDHSEMEIRTEGGRETKYEIHADVHERGGFSIVFDDGEKQFDSHGAVSIEHTSGPSESGESDVRIHVK